MIDLTNAIDIFEKQFPTREIRAIRENNDEFVFSIADKKTHSMVVGLCVLVSKSDGSVHKVSPMYPMEHKDLKIIPLNEVE